MEWLLNAENAKKIVVYGAGDYSRCVVRWLEVDVFLFHKIAAIVVSAKTENDPDEICGIKVINFNELDIDSKNTLVLVAVAQEKHQEIISNVKKGGYEFISTMSIHDYYYMRRMLKREHDYKSRISYLEKRLENYGREIFSAINLDRLMAESRWLKRKDFSAGGAAVDNNYLYLLYKILDSNKFSAVLDIGMGQTSKMISQYANFDSNFSHLIIEEDRKWAEIFSGSMHFTKNIELQFMDYKIIKNENSFVRVYEKFGETLKNRKFDFISIDAPIGIDMNEQSRIDILQLLPMCLKDSWIIMMDDSERKGEKNTIFEIKKILDTHGIKYQSRNFSGVKEFIIMVSEDNKCFLTC